MSRVPSEDVDEVQADWKKASLEEKKQMVWDVRKLLDDDDDGDDDGDDDAPKPKHADAPKPPPKSAPPPPRGGYKDDSKSEVRRRGGGAARPKCPGSPQSTQLPATPETRLFRATLWARERGEPSTRGCRKEGCGGAPVPAQGCRPPRLLAMQAARAGRSTRTSSTTSSARPTAATGTSTITRRRSAPRAAAPTCSSRAGGAVLVAPQLATLACCG